MSFNQYIPPEDEINSGEHYFAASNTYLGFKSYFDKIFNPEKFERIYILKGGPGVGKSTLMKKAANKALEQGLSPVCYHCSSDPYSLDGIVIKELKTAVIDGTYPHTTDPTAAGVKEIIVNMGECWDTEKLKQSGGAILPLISKKSACYRASYKFLSAEKQIKDCLSEISSLCLCKEKLLADVDRKCKKLFKKLPPEKNSQKQNTVRITAANSCFGNVRFSTFEKNAKNLCFIKDLRFTAEIYLKELLSQSQKYGAKAVISYSPNDPDVIDALYFPEVSACFTPYDDSLCISLEKSKTQYTVVNMRRFSDSSVYSKNRAYYRFGEKCRDEMHQKALEYLSEAGTLHGQIEALYSTATDYDKVSVMTQELLEHIF